MIDIAALERYFKVIKKKKLAEKTRGTYLYAAKLINKRLLPGEEITQEFYEDLVESINAKHNSETAANNYIAAMNHWIDYLDYKSVSHGLKRLTGTNYGVTAVTSDKILTPSEMEAIYNKQMYYSGNEKVNDHLNRVYSTILMFISQTGCRNDEARQLLISSVNLEKREVWFFHNKVNHTKGKKSRVAYLESPILVERLTELIGGRPGHELVFTSSHGGKITQYNLGNNLKRRVKALGIKKDLKDVRLHLLRHSYSADLVENSCPVEDVSVLLGHADIKTTMAFYGHFSSQRLRNANRLQTNVKKTLEPQTVVDQDFEILKKLTIFNDGRFANKEEILAKLKLEVLQSIKD